MKEDREVFAQHLDLHIVARDSWSYEYLTEHFRNNSYLAPDMAFYINLDTYRYDVKKMSTPTPNTLYVKRGDHEAICEKVEGILTNKDCDICDWPTIGVENLAIYQSLSRKNAFEKIMVLLTRQSKNPIVQYTTNWFLFHWLMGWNLRFNYALDNYINRWMACNYLTPIFAIGKEFVEKYEVVVTDRLHVGILCVLLGVNIQLIDNNYCKNSRFYNTWLRGFSNIMLIQKS
jgi:pyruvyl transferase EpsO